MHKLQQPLLTLLRWSFLPASRQEPLWGDGKKAMSSPFMELGGHPAQLAIQARLKVSVIHEVLPQAVTPMIRDAAASSHLNSRRQCLLKPLAAEVTGGIPAH